MSEVQDQPLTHEYLAHFTGTDRYHLWTPLFKDVLTNGACAVAERGGAYWLMDAISSHLMGRKEGLAVSTLTKNGDGATLTITDGNENVFATQEIEYTDFPLDEIVIWSQWYPPVGGHVHMLRSEY